MDKKLMVFCDGLKTDIEKSYEEGVTIEQAEKLAAKFLAASLTIGEALRVADLDRRMRRSGVKAIKAAVYLDAATKGDKKPSDKLIEAVVNSDKIVAEQQQSFDEAEVYVNQLENFLSVFHEAHLYFRGIGKGQYNG
jgi:hypothetical protein